jgi:hypothetical protein
VYCVENQAKWSAGGDDSWFYRGTETEWTHTLYIQNAQAKTTVLSCLTHLYKEHPTLGTLALLWGCPAAGLDIMGVVPRNGILKWAINTPHLMSTINI